MKLPISITVYGETIECPTRRNKTETCENNVTETIITLRGHYYKNTIESDGSSHHHTGFEISFDEGTMIRWVCSDTPDGIEKQRECLEYQHGAWTIASTYTEAA